MADTLPHDTRIDEEDRATVGSCSCGWKRRIKWTSHVRSGLAFSIALTLVNTHREES